MKIKGTSEPVRIKTDMDLSTAGALIDHGTGNPVKVASAYSTLSLDSRLPDEVWAEIKYVDFKSATGYLHLFVQATSREMHENALFDTYVRIHTAVGILQLDGSIMTFLDPELKGVFESAGFEVTQHSRRLLGIFELVGMFNSVPSFEGWDATHDLPPKMPVTFRASAQLLFACKREDEDFCANYAVPPANQVAIAGLQWASSSLDLWSDAAAGKTHEKMCAPPQKSLPTTPRPSLRSGLDAKRRSLSASSLVLEAPTYRTYQDGLWILGRT